MAAAPPSVLGLSPTDAVAAGAVVAMAALHLFAWRLRSFDVVPRSGLLSAAGGSSVAYVFVHALPELERAGATLGRRAGALAFLEEHAYLLALAGFVVYYGMERYVERRGGRGSGGQSPTGTFRVHVGSFAAYNGLIGYLLFHPDAPGVGGLVVFAVAMGLHLLVVDHGLRQHHADRYRHYGRWLLAGALVAGGALGAVTTIRRGAVAALFAFLAGGVVLNVIKEELPPERESRFSAFAAGAAAYAALLLLL